MINIAINDETRRLMGEDAKRLNNMKLVHLVEVYRRGWQMLTPEQQLAAITNQPAPSEPATDAGDPVVAASEVSTAAAQLTQTAVTAKADGVLDAHEKQAIRAGVRQVQHKLTKIAAAV